MTEREKIGDYYRNDVDQAVATAEIQHNRAGDPGFRMRCYAAVECGALQLNRRFFQDIVDGAKVNTLSYFVLSPSGQLTWQEVWAAADTYRRTNMEIARQVVR